MTDDSTKQRDSCGGLFLSELRAGYVRQKVLAEEAFAQLEVPDWHKTLDQEGNSVAVLVRHLAGNLTSRFTDFLTTDGEKPSRDRDGEFESTGMAPSELMAEWDAGWSVLFTALAELAEADLLKTVTIRGQEHTVMRALVRNYDHSGHHVGQIVMLAKRWRGGKWQTLSIPKRR
ncbi:MAG TPA: DUF1572 family protein [Trueperaceae bacterium]|nr:DUF1572 family protein [Trueperaceae bacterium]